MGIKLMLKQCRCKLPCEVSAQHAFQYRAEEEAEQGAQSRLQSLPGFPAAEKFADKSP